MGFKRGQQSFERFSFDRGKDAGFRIELLEQDVLVPNRSQHRAQPPEFLLQGRIPFRLQQDSGCPQERSKSSDSHAHLVEFFRVFAGSRSGVVEQDVPELFLQDGFETFREGC